MAKNNRLFRYLKFLLIPTMFVFILLVANLLADAVSLENNDGSPAWSNPRVMAIKHIGLAPEVPDQPNFQSNLDCVQITYRRVNYDAMESGCFVRTAYGLVNPDNELVIFNGADEALPIIPYLPHQVLTPSPNSTDTLTLNPALTDGSYLGIYRNIIGTIADQRNYQGELVAKNVTSAQELNLNNTDGSRLVINPQAMAFSSDGSWLVVETLSGSFVRINLTTLETIAFTQSFGMQGSPALLKSQVAVSSDGRYVAIENSYASSLVVYDLSTCFGDRTSIKPLNCKNYDFWTYVNAEFAGLDRIGHLRFINDRLLGFRASYLGNYDSFELAPTLEIKSLIDYLALGDSYTSGEGAFDYFAGTDTVSNSCHLSLHSYPLLLAQQFYGGSGGHSVACSGAKIGDILPLYPSKYKGQARDALVMSQLPTSVKSQIMASFMPGYLPQIEFVNQYQPRVVTVSVGGNDIGFADILQNCVMPHVSPSIWSQDCYNTYEDRVELQNLIDSTVPKWVLLFRHLKTVSPTSNVSVIGYPQIFYNKGDCALNVQLSKSELQFSAELTDYLNSAIQKSALLAGVDFIDISEALHGYRLCETTSNNVAVNGLTAGKDAGFLGLKILGSESYHPTAFGQALIEESISKQIDTIKIDVAEDVEQSFLNAPKSGRQIVTLIPTSGMTNQIILKGKASTITVGGVASGLKANEAYSLVLDRYKGPIISNVITDQNGDISTTFTLPLNTLIGGHTIDIIGINQIRQTVDLSQPIYVVASDSDADGDGIINTNDSCPLAVNSGIDSDQDGIDDVCDGFIGSVQNNSGGGVNTGAELSPKNDLIISGDNQAVKVQKSAIKSSSIIAGQSVQTVTNKSSYSASQPSKKIPKINNAPIKPVAHRHLTMGNWIDSTWRLCLLLIFTYLMYEIIQQLIHKARMRIYYRYATRNSLGQGMPIAY